MPPYFSKKDPETKWLIDQCTEGFEPEVKLNYLINLLSSKWVQNKTPKEIFQAELNAKKGFETNIKRA